MDKFEKWWKDYCKVSSLNREHLSFLDVTILKEEMKLAYYRKLPDKATRKDRRVGWEKR